MTDPVWLDKAVYDRAECLHYERLALKRKRENTNEHSIDQDDHHVNNENEEDECCTDSVDQIFGGIAKKVAMTRKRIVQSLQSINIENTGLDEKEDLKSRITALAKSNCDLVKTVTDLTNLCNQLSDRVTALEQRIPYVAICPPKPEPAEVKTDDDNDVDLFGSDSETEDIEKARIKEERLAAYAAKKSKKPTVIAKSNIILDIKPFGDKTDMQAMEKEVRKIETDGLVWGASKFVPLVFGIHKLQISCVVEDEKVSIDWLTEEIENIKDYVQSVDIAAFNKI